MKQVRDGQLSQMGLLFQRHHRDLFSFFYRMTNDQVQSEDLVQSVFYRLLKYRNKYREDVNFSYWLYAIAKNVWRDTFRKKDPLRQSKDIDTLQKHVSNEKSIVQQMEENDRTLLVRKALNRLSQEKREAIILSRYQGMKYQEIAKLCNCTENAIKSRVQRGLLELKSIMTELELEKII